MFDGPGDIVLTEDGFGIMGANGIVPLRSAFARVDAAQETERLSAGFRLVLTLP